MINKTPMAGDYKSAHKLKIPELKKEKKIVECLTDLKQF
jgi:hypothetical protein